MSNTIDILDSESDSDFFSPKNIYKDQKRKSSTPSQGCVDVNPDLAQSKHPQNTPRDEKSPSIPPFISDSAKNINCKSAYFSVSSETESNGNSSDTDFGTSDAEDNETDKENQTPRQKLCSPAASSDVDFETSGSTRKAQQQNPCGAKQKSAKKRNNTKLKRAHNHVVVKLENAHSLTETSSSEDCDESADSNKFEPKQGLKFKLFEHGYDKCQKYATKRGFRWTRTTRTKDRGHKRQYAIRRLVCQSYGKKQNTKTKGMRDFGPSVRCGCKAAITLYEHMRTGETYIHKVNLAHSYPCQPGKHQLLRGRRKSGVNPSSIPLEILKELANMFHAKVSTQSIRELLSMKPNFPHSIVIDPDFVRNMRLYVERHEIVVDMPVSIIREKLNLSADMSAINYEDVIIAASMTHSVPALAAREANAQHIQDVLAFLSFVGLKDPMFAKKVCKLTPPPPKPLHNIIPSGRLCT